MRDEPDAAVGSQPAWAGAGLWSQAPAPPPTKAKLGVVRCLEPAPPPPSAMTVFRVTLPVKKQRHAGKATKRSACTLKGPRSHVVKPPPPPPALSAQRGKEPALIGRPLKKKKKKAPKGDPLVDCTHCKMAVRTAARAGRRSRHALSPPRGLSARAESAQQIRRSNFSKHRVSDVHVARLREQGILDGSDDASRLEKRRTWCAACGVFVSKTNISKHKASTQHKRGLRAQIGAL